MWWKPLLYLQGCIWKKILDHNVNYPVTGFDFQKRNYWLRNILIRVRMERNVCIPLPFSYCEIRRCWRKKKDIWKYLICLMLSRRSLLLYYFTGRSLSLFGCLGRASNWSHVAHWNAIADQRATRARRSIL